MVEVTVNGAPCTVESDSTVADLLEKLGISGRLAVERNGVIVPRSRHREERLAPGDVLEIVHAVGGG